MPDIRALTLREPFASLIAAGVKQIETRSWRTSYRGPLYIHAGAAKISRGDPRMQKLLALLPDRQPAYGLVVCRCQLADCRLMDEAFLSSMTDPVERLCGEYASGRYAWLLEKIEPLAEPFPAKGMLGLWKLSEPHSP